jgi:hypothetical protein
MATVIPWSVVGAGLVRLEKRRGTDVSDYLFSDLPSSDWRPTVYRGLSLLAVLGYPGHIVRRAEDAAQGIMTHGRWIRDDPGASGTIEGRT